MPPAKSKITAGYIRTLWNELSPRFEHEWSRMRLVEAWRTLNRHALEDHIWAGVSKQDRGKTTIVKNHVASVTASAIALASSPEPTMNVVMRNRISPRSQDASNFNRRASYAMRSAVNRHRSRPWEDEVTDFIFARAVGIVKYWYADPEMRGEVRRPVTAEDAAEYSDAAIVVDEEAGTTELITEDGDFPGMVEVLDPLDCVYVLGPGKTGATCFIHRYMCPPHDLLAAYPDAAEKLGLGDNISGHADFEVWDYWDEKYHAIAVDDQFYYEPSEHYYKRLPFEIERVNEQKLFLGLYPGGNTVEINQTGQLASITSGRGSYITAATPFPWPMIDDVAKASFAESLLANKLPEMANTPIIHYGISTGEAGRPASPHFARVRRASDGKLSRVPIYSFRGDKTSGGRPIWPAFDGENFMPLNPTPMADHLALFMQQRNADLEISGMNAELLSGRIRSEPSGFSVNQQIQLTSARMNPYLGGRNRLVSKVYTGLFEALDQNWDRGDAPFILVSLTDEEDIPLTREIVSGVVEVIYTVENIFPRDREAEMQMAFQMHAQGGMPLYELIRLYGKAEDPKDWLERIAWERVALQDPQFLRSLAMAYHKKLGYGDMGPSPQAEQQAGAMQQMGAMAGAMPPEEAGGPSPNGQAPPEIAAALGAAMQGGG